LPSCPTSWRFSKYPAYSAIQAQAACLLPSRISRRSSKALLITLICATADPIALSTTPLLPDEYLGLFSQIVLPAPFFALTLAISFTTAIIAGS
jgi:hypothetical protein